MRKLFLKTLSAISLSEVEVDKNKNLGVTFFPLTINYKDVARNFYFRKYSSIDILDKYTRFWEFNTGLFDVQSGIDVIHGKHFKIVSKHKFCDKDYDEKITGINFLSAGQQAATFALNDKRTNSQIEQMTGNKVKPRGVVSPFKHGGFVVFEENGHGLVASIIDLGKMDGYSAIKVCDELISNGYNDWHLPTKKSYHWFLIFLERLGPFILTITNIGVVQKTMIIFGLKSHLTAIQK